MKRLIFKPIIALASLWGKMLPERIVLVWQDLRNKCYAAYLKHFFVGAEELIINGSPVCVTGGRYIRMGRRVTLGSWARLEATYCWENCSQTFTPQVVIGDNVVLAPFSRIGCINRVEIGDWTTTGQRVYITDHTHGDVSYEQLNLPPRHRPLYSKGPVKIGAYVHIGENSCIMPGVTIGDHSVIGAGSIVTHDIPPYTVAAGNPAKVLKTITAPSDSPQREDFN
jgi:acetyltransferase-like isoleucine patch superfamily enzyme